MSALNNEDEIGNLKRKVVDLKSQLAILQSVIQGEYTPAEPVSHFDRKRFRFLDLPRELRNEVYEYCLTPGKVFIYHATSIKTYDMRFDDDFARPDVQLFYVCKQLYSEAWEVFVMKNLFVLTSGPVTTLPTLRKFIASIDTKLLRRLSISLDYRDYAVSSAGEGYQRITRRALESQGLGLAGRRRSIIEIATRQIRTKIWYPLVATLAPLRNLDYLQLNLQNCFDPTGVERFVDHALTSKCTKTIMRKGWKHPVETMTTILESIIELKSLKTIDVVGTFHRDERDLIRAVFATANKSDLLHFHAGLGCVDGDSELAFDEEQEVKEYGGGANEEEEGDGESLPPPPDSESESGSEVGAEGDEE